MTRIEIPFRYDMAEAAIAGNKSATSRNVKYGEPGDTFLVWGTEFVLINVTPQYLNTVAEARYREEGFDSPGAFIQVWKELHPVNGWEPHKRIWFHEFKRSGV